MFPPSARGRPSAGGLKGPFGESSQSLVARDERSRLVAQVLLLMLHSMKTPRQARPITARGTAGHLWSE